MPASRDFTFWVALPEGLGAVTKLRREGDRIVADTTSGIPFIVPLYGHSNPVFKRI